MTFQFQLQLITTLTKRHSNTHTHNTKGLSLSVPLSPVSGCDIRLNINTVVKIQQKRLTTLASICNSKLLHHAK